MRSAPNFCLQPTTKIPQRVKGELKCFEGRRARWRLLGGFLEREENHRQTQGRVCGNTRNHIEQRDEMQRKRRGREPGASPVEPPRTPDVIAPAAIAMTAQPQVTALKLPTCLPTCQSHPNSKVAQAAFNRRRDPSPRAEAESARPREERASRADNGLLCSVTCLTTQERSSSRHRPLILPFPQPL
ncbi:hypothetical protein SKAU_G00122770 [Synaphobranchus kaupii]|uniref:Uncharacterized protein n=1 Tax=Synaphobranchus kaupii TaxID=118154 RepID=A0A9Q1FNU9_SYNKA|nr:hypothetical protein SKAU_G00122770 [Synaphobranchus kaupii]